MDVPLRIELLQQEIAEMKAALPAHSVPAATLMVLEDLEEELADWLAQGVEGGDAPA